MEGEKESYEEQKPRIGQEEVNNNINDMGTVGKMGSCKESVQLWTNTSRAATMASSEPSSTIPAPDQLTIFYGGRVVVFDGIPAEKVREIMLIATTAAAAAAAAKPGEMKKNGSATPASTPVLSRSPSMQSTSSAMASPRAQLYPIHQGSLCKLQAELPIARKHSLQRFFEKRRDRLESKNPYPTTPGGKMSEPKPSVSTEASPDGGCGGKPIASEEELQRKVTTNLA